MSLERIDKKPCDCPIESFRYVKKNYIINEGPYQIVHSYEIKECIKHQKTWGRRRQEEKVISCIEPVKDFKIDEVDLEFFKSVFSSLWKEKINDNLWNKKLIKKYNNQNFDEITNGFIQKGLIFKEISIVQKSNKETHYVLLTELGKKKIKRLIGFISIKEQISLGKKEINKALKEKNYNLLSNNEKTLYDLLKDQMKRLESGDPKFFRFDKAPLIPKNSAVNPPKYLIILFAFSRWLKIYRKVLTLRELSARTFQNSPIMLYTDPSKILDNYRNDLDNILFKFASVKCEDLGLILALDNFIFSGEIEIELIDGQRKVLKGPSFSISNLLNMSIKEVSVHANKILLIENSHVYAQLVLDDWSLKNKTCVIFIKGMGIMSLFKKNIIKRIVEDNPSLEYWFWLDHDFGGCFIYNESSKIFKNCKKYLIQYPSNIEIPFRPISEVQRSKMKSYLNSLDLELKVFARSIYKNGKVEQEYLLEWYEQILEYNFSRIK